MKKQILGLAVLTTAMLITGCSSQELKTITDSIVNDAKETIINDTKEALEKEAKEALDSLISDISIGDNTDYQSSASDEYITYEFRNEKLLDQHYEKHGVEMGFGSAEDYQSAASDVINNPDVLHKGESEDDDEVYYLEVTNEFVVLSEDGYIRTYFKPDSGKSYYDKQ